jgi:hypothetical protein
LLLPPSTFLLPPLCIKTLICHVSPFVFLFCQQLSFTFPSCTSFSVFLFYHGFSSSSFIRLFILYTHARPDGKHA